MGNYIAAIRYGEGSSPRWAVLDTITRTWYFPALNGKKAAQSMAADLNKIDDRKPKLEKRKYRCYYLTSATTVEATSDYEAGIIAASMWNTTPSAVMVLSV